MSIGSQGAHATRTVFLRALDAFFSHMTENRPKIQFQKFRNFIVMH
jgi:hypothetical protein